METRIKKRIEIFAMIAICSILALVSTFFAFRIVYPKKYNSDILANSQKNSLDSNLIRAVIWVESRYDKDAKSRAGAVGLMQLMPSTASWIHSKIDNAQFDLNNPSDNIKIGSYYLKYLVEKYQDIELALIAYNAGPNTLTAWLKDIRYSKDGTLTVIPFKETREYVKKVLKTKTIYDKLY